MENCTKFGQLILSKTIKIVASSCETLRPKCTKFDFGWGSAPDLAGGAYSAPLRQSSWISEGLLLRGGEWKEMDERSLLVHLQLAAAGDAACLYAA